MTKQEEAKRDVAKERTRQMKIQADKEIKKAEIDATIKIEEGKRKLVQEETKKIYAETKKLEVQAKLRKDRNQATRRMSSESPLQHGTRSMTDSQRNRQKNEIHTVWK